MRTVDREDRRLPREHKRKRVRAGPAFGADAAMAERKPGMGEGDARRRDGPRRDRPKGKSASKRARERRETSELWWRFMVKLLLVAVILVAVFRFVLGVQIQRGNRMYPFIMDGDLVVTYKLDDYREGDVVAYRRPDNGGVAISRIAARGPGEVRLDSGGLTLNGSVRGISPFYTTQPLTENGPTYPFNLSASGYFLLDDNRESGSDSRAFGEVRRWELLGKVVYVFRRRGI